MFYTIKQTISLILLSAVFATSVVTTSASAQTMSARATEGVQVAVSADNEDESARNSAAILGNARTIYIWSRTVFVKQEVIESALLKRDDYRQSRLLITKDKDAADLILTVRRANFTTEYPYDVVDQRTRLVVAGGKVNSLFGTAAGKIASGFMKQIKKARSLAPSKATK
jgi:hypothetical protein